VFVVVSFSTVCYFDFRFYAARDRLELWAICPSGSAFLQFSVLFFAGFRALLATRMLIRFNIGSAWSPLGVLPSWLGSIPNTSAD